DGTGTGYITELGGNRVRKINLTGYSLTGTLPAGLTFDPATGIISGTPTAQTANTQFSVTAYNAYGYSTSTFNIKASAGLPNNPAGDYDKNWVYVRTYDENGVEIGAAKSFYDNNAKPTQTQTKNETTGNVLATQTIYDLQSRPVISTLSAPTNNSAFAYSPNFVTANNLPYSYLNFDGDPTNTTTPYAKLNNPDAVDNATQGTLGWYYSDNNTSEPYVAATGFPYSRSDFYNDGTGAPKRSAGIGEQLKMGMGREVTGNSFPVQNELSNYVAIRNQFFPSTVIGNTPAGMAGQALQAASKDQNGTTAVTITDLSGKMTLMTARADASADAWLSVNNTLSLSNSMTQYSLTVNISANLINSLTINSANTVTVYASIPGSPGCTHCQVYQGAGNSYSFAGSGYSSCQVVSANPFTVTASNAVGVVYDQSEAAYAEPSGSAIQYFQLVTPSLVTLTGSYTLYDMSSESDITTSFNNGSNLTAGYYKVIANATTDPSVTNTVTVAYTSKYSDISYNYYNQLGQLTASIAPKGVQQLLANGYSSISSASQLPFVSLYSYDLQGRLTSATTPDGGTSNYVYRTDGKIRFSQNAYQANPANAGQSNSEKLSYTNYDNAGRPLESGEYIAPAGTFAALSANTTLLDATDVTANIIGATKQSQINTYYDLPDPSPAYTSSLTGYVQDPDFLKGAVSYTSNANSTTWYNYDDHGRLTWMVKSISGLGYKTVDYTYNDQGNVTKVDYQKGTSSERFIHYYTYDADGRLTNVQTSRDDIAANKVQQANYYYYLHGPLKRVELGDHLQGIDYVYTAQGWLKSINTPTQNIANDPGKDGTGNSFANDAFGMQMEYFPNDYYRGNTNINTVQTGQPTYYNGNVNGISWQSNKPSSALTNNPNIQNPNMYAYSYDAKYQLTGATWGTPSFTGSPFSPQSIFKEQVTGYDANGNITGLQRTDGSGAVMDNDNFSKYSYQSGANQLLGVGTNSNPSAYASYTYDEIGRLKSETLVGAPNPYYLQYDVTGKITGIYSDASLSAQSLTESYSYDESGNRIKTTNANGTTYYVYDASDNVIAIYTGTAPTITEAPFYGADRLGTYFYSGSNYQYELRDQVGSVRLVINGTKNSNGQADIVTYNDYYPYGSVAQSTSTPYRYTYQGAYAEKDEVTGWNNFQLRMYDAKIGRWLTIDPAGQFASPYEGMGNNPVTGTDPTGADCPDCPVFGMWEGTEFDSSDGNTYTVNDGEWVLSRQLAGVEISDKAPNWVNQRINIYNKIYDQVKADYKQQAGNFFLGYPDNLKQIANARFANLLKTNDFLGGRATGAGGIRPVYVEFDAALFVATAGTSAEVEAADAEIKVFRVFGGDSQGLGRSWTPIDPSTVSNYRSLAGLPEGNTAQFIIEGTVKQSDIIMTKGADIIYKGQQEGGLTEFIIDPKNVKITNVSGINPPY
ncbi:MAG TPA: RHS repeat-associated core domain-containing protein, partial [Mucilaginibacter sp.]